MNTDITVLTPSSVPLRAPSVLNMTAYCAGLMPDDEQTDFLESILMYDDAHNYLHSVRMELKSLTKVDWLKAREVARSGDPSELRTQVARAWTDLAPEANSRNVMQGGRLTAMLEQWGLALRRKELALVRGESLYVQDSISSGMRSEARVDAMGLLHVTAAMHNRNDPRKILRLEIRHGDAFIPVGHSLVKQGLAQWNVTVGNNAPIGAVPQSSYRLVSDDEPIPQITIDRLIAEIIEPDGRVTRSPIFVDLVEQPIWSDGSLRLSISLPKPAYIALKRAEMELELLLGANSRQMLGIWPVSTLPEGIITLTVPCPEVDTNQACLPVRLRFRLR